MLLLIETVQSINFPDKKVLGKGTDHIDGCLSIFL